MLIYTHCWELMNSVGSHGSSSLPFAMKVMVCHFVSDSREVMTALIVMLPLIVVVEISLQLHRFFSAGKDIYICSHRHCNVLSKAILAFSCPCSWMMVNLYSLQFQQGCLWTQQ
jgi:hypothetical protein